MLIYNLFILLYTLGIRLAAPFSAKARAWRRGRRQWYPRLRRELDEKGPGPWIWMHCASAGEFEQGKPVLEALKARYPQHRLLVTFFSPSGYTVGVKWKGADLVTYLPADTARNARRFVGLIQPELVIFVKYDYWYHHLAAIHKKQVPLLLVSAIFRPTQAFFRWYGHTQRRLLSFFTWLFVQDDVSVDLLESIGVRHCSAAGDTRFDRVATLTQSAAALPLIERFAAAGGPILVAGSTWPEDEELLAALPATVRLIIAPHEIDTAHIAAIRARFGASSINYSELEQQESAAVLRVLVIDNFGMLSRLYRYGDLTYIGGGFNKSGIHNTLEAAAWGKPVLFGPNYQKFREAKGLIAQGAAASVVTADDLQRAVAQLLEDGDLRAQWGNAAAHYVSANIGATGRILQLIQEKRLLTSA